MKEYWNRFRNWARRDALADELDRELRFHANMIEDEQRRRGMSPADAAAFARREMGNRTSIREQSRDVWSFVWIDDMVQDVRTAVRGFRKSVLFTSVAVLSLGVGIGASTTVFSVIDTLDFRQLPYRDADRLVWLAETTPATHEFGGGWPLNVAPATLYDWATTAKAFDRVEAVDEDNLSWEHDDVVESLQTTRATTGLLGLLGVQPQMGRGFVPADTAAGAEPVALITEIFWKTKLGGDRNVIGARLRSVGSIQATPTVVTIVGVLPPDFHFKSESPVWTPLRIDPSGSRTARVLDGIARLGEGQSFASAATELRTQTSRLARDHLKAYDGWGISVKPLRNLMSRSGGNNRFVFFAITLLVLLVAVLNVAGLMSARSQSRAAEFAVRTALGANRGRLLRQLIVEGLCIGLAGGAVGVIVTTNAMQFVTRWLSLEHTGLAFGTRLSTIAFAAGLSIVVGCVSSIGPALRSSRLTNVATLRVKPHDTTRQTVRAGGALLVTQISVALSLLAAATLLSKDFLTVRYLDLGYKPEGLYLTWVNGVRGAVSLDSWQAQAMAARDAVARIPGVAAATLEHRSGVHPSVVYAEPGRPPKSDRGQPNVRAVSHDYFKTLGSRIVLGRDFSVHDQSASQPVAIVNEEAAHRLWPGKAAIGQHIFIGDSTVGTSVTVIGVVRDVERGEMVERHWPMIFRPLDQAPAYHAAAALYVRIDNRSAQTIAAVQAAVRSTMGRSVEPLVAQTHQVSNKFKVRKFNAIVLSAFATFGLLLATMGIYGSVAYSATQRTREIGIRLALGAKRSSVIATLTKRGVAIATVGVGLGLFGSFAISRVLRAMVVASDVTAVSLYISVGLFMFSVVLIATMIPAIRASRIDPVAALRAE